MWVGEEMMKKEDARKAETTEKKIAKEATDSGRTPCKGVRASARAYVRRWRGALWNKEAFASLSKCVNVDICVHACSLLCVCQCVCVRER